VLYTAGGGEVTRISLVASVELPRDMKGSIVASLMTCGEVLDIPRLRGLMDV